MVAYDLWSTTEVHRAELCPGAFPHLPTDQWTPRQDSRLAALRQLGAVPGALSISFSLVQVPFPLRRFLVDCRRSGNYHAGAMWGARTQLPEMK